jgi:hypothetical protein
MRQNVTRGLTTVKGFGVARLRRHVSSPSADPGGAPRNAAGEFNTSGKCATEIGMLAAASCRIMSAPFSAIIAIADRHSIMARSRPPRPTAGARSRQWLNVGY